MASYSAWQLSLCVFVLGFSLSPLRAQQDTAQTDPSSIAKPDPDLSGDSSAPGKNLSGLAVIVKIESAAGDTLFHADGYRIRVGSGTEVEFSGGLKTLADVAPNTWVHFEGVRDGTGVLVARKATFFPPGSHKTSAPTGSQKAQKVPDYQPVIHDSILDANGHFVSIRTKVRLSDSAGPCGWHKVPADQALQERVERIGMSVVPAYQKQLPHDSPYRIPFRFYATADDKVRSVFVCNDGLVLIPKNVVERFQNDDQLASVLADGVAFDLKSSLAAFAPLALAMDATAVAAVFPATFIAGDIAFGVEDYEFKLMLVRDCARIALQLMADAGYDPWQAPEALRLLAPANPPKDIGSLSYTREGKYQLSILKLQYKPAESSEVLPASVPYMNRPN